MTENSTVVISEPSLSSSSASSSFALSHQQHHLPPSNNNPAIITADDLIAEAFLRCARMRTCFTVWRSKSHKRARRYSASLKIADVFRRNFRLWRILEHWRRRAEEQSRISNMSLIAWGWHARRSKRRVLQGWRAYCDEKAIRRERNQVAAMEMRQQSQGRLCSGYFFTWMAFASRCHAADAFCAFKTNKDLTLRPALKKWRRRLLTTKLHQIQVEFLQSRIRLENSFRFFNAWFLEAFAARRKVLLDYYAKLESFATWHHQRNLLLKKCFVKKWVPRMRNSVADRFHRQHTLRRCLIHIWKNEKFARAKSLRMRVEYFENHHEGKAQRRTHDRVAAMFNHWRRRVLLKKLFEDFENRRCANVKVDVFARWKIKLEQRNEFKKWTKASAEVRRNFVLKRGFENLLDSASKICSFNHQNQNQQHMQQQRQQQHHDPNRMSSQFYENSSNNADLLSAERIESSLRSLLATYRTLQLTSGADREILLGQQAHHHQLSVSSEQREAAASRQKERERLKGTILHLREALARISSE